MSQSDNLLDIISVLWKWRKQIATITSLAVIGTIVISLMLPNYYKASTSFYAGSEDLAKPNPVGELDRARRYYGTDTDIDRLLSIAGSKELSSSIIEEFDLYNHYQIDPKSKNAQHKISLQFDKIFEVNKTRLDAIQLSVEDKDPAMSAKMANAARDKLNSIAQQTVKQSQLQLLQLFEKKIKDDSENLSVLNDTLTSVKQRYNIYALEGQVQVLLEQLSYVKSKGQLKQAALLQKQIDNFNAGFAKASSLSSEHLELSEQLSIDKEKYKQLQASYDSPYSAIHVIESASTPLIKSRPRRSLYVIASGMFSLLFSVLGVLIIDAFNKVQWKQVLND